MIASFSRRTGWDLTPNRLTRALDLRRRARREVLDLTTSNPTVVGLPVPADLLAPLADPGGLAYAPEPCGLPVAREAVAADFARRGMAVAADRIVLTASTSEAYALLFKLLADPGDEILVPAPSYPLFGFLAGLECVEVATYPLSYDGAWHLSVDGLARLVGPRTRALVVVAPNNPTGSWLTRAEAAALSRLAAERGLAVISDEVFADFPLVPDDGARAGGLLPEAEALTFALGGLSKSCALPQLKLGWIAMGGAGAEAAHARLEVVADTYLSVGTPVQRALPALLARGEELRAPIRARLGESLAALRTALPPSSPVSLLRAEGGWSAVLRLPALRSEEDVCVDLLERDGVLVHPGHFFDFPTGAHAVVSLLVPPPDLARGVAAVVARGDRS